MNNNIEDEDGYFVVIEQPIENIISKDNICYNQAADTNYDQVDTRHTTTSTVTRESGKDSKTKFIIAIVVIVLVLSAICVCTIYLLVPLMRLVDTLITSVPVLTSIEQVVPPLLLHSWGMITSVIQAVKATRSIYFL